jgi:hypothetical protein
MTVIRPLALAAAAVLALVGCAATPTTTPQPAPEILAEFDLAGLDGRQIIDRLDRVPVVARQADLRASVRPGELLLSTVGSEQTTAIDLPDDLFYLSVAPYLEQTHDCFFHSLTTCRGELGGKQVKVTITQGDTGAVLVDTVTETFDNGFVGFWLPSGIAATIDVEYEGHSGSSSISTGPDDPTCLTTIQLQRQ